MADDKRDNGRHADPRAEKSAAAAEDMTPVPTQAELDGLAGGDESKKREARKPAEAPLPPTPTQDEANEHKAAVYGVEVPKKRDPKEATAHAAEEDLTPTPTQAEANQHKLDAMYTPEGSGDPQKAEAAMAGQQHRRHIEATPPRPGYQTRAAAPAPAAEPVKAD